MTIPRQLGPDSGVRRVLPDFSRSAATIERMVRELQAGGTRKTVIGTARARTRVLFPAEELRDTVLRAMLAAVLLAAATICALVALLVGLEVPDGRAPGVGVLLVLLALGAAAVLLALLGARFAIVAVGTARSRVELREDGVRVMGAFSSRTVAWEDIAAVESRVIHPVHWLTVALRRRDGSRVVIPAFDRHVWQYGAPTGADVRAVRTAVHHRQRASSALPR